MTKEKNIDASAEKDKFADELLSNKELDSVAGGTTARMYDEAYESKTRLDSVRKHGTSTRF